MAASQPDPATTEPSEEPPQRRLWDFLGPGLITGASDDDPSGIATYSQIGAQYGYSMAWTMLFSYPLMAGIQEISARIGRVTGEGVAGNLRRHYPAWILRAMIGLLIVANVINLGADLGGMADALRLMVGGPSEAYVVAFALVCCGLEVFSRYDRYVAILKWTTLSLLAYVATVLAVKISWRDVAFHTLVPELSWDHDAIVGIVAVLGTTISPYLMFWQASEEAEDERVASDAEPLLMAPGQAPREFRRIHLDTYVGMAYSNLVALGIIITTAATLHEHGITFIQTSAQAAEALRPIAGPFAFAVFALGIIGTGLLAIPVLAGSVAYAVGEALGWPVGLARLPHEAKAFYGTIVVSTCLGIAITLVALDPITALFWSAVINGIIAVPLMVIMMVMSANPAVMGQFRLPKLLAVFGWAATVTMAATVIAMAWALVT